MKQFSSVLRHGTDNSGQVKIVKKMTVQVDFDLSFNAILSRVQYGA